MRDIIENAIDWEKIGACGRERAEYTVDQAAIHKRTRVLHLRVKTNFVIPYENLHRIQRRLMEDLQQISGVSFDFLYGGMIQSDAEIIERYLPYLIESEGPEAAPLTRTIRQEGCVYDANARTFRIRALGAAAVKRLNRSAAARFSQQLKTRFSIDVTVLFENDEEAYEDKAREANEEILSEIRATCRNPGNGKNTGVQGIVRAEAKKSTGESGRLIGRKITEPIGDIRSLSRESGMCCVQGKLFGKSTRQTKNGKIMATLFLFDKTGSLCVKFFLTAEKWDEIDRLLEIGGGVKARGEVGYDNYENGLVMMGKDLETMPSIHRMDEAVLKRVELHAHTKMSAMDGFIDTADMIDTAARWGHKAVAVTDHGVAQSFPEAMDAERRLKGAVKVIYGIEGYVFNDEAPYASYPPDLSTESEFVVFDIETTGLSPYTDEIIEIGAVRVRGKTMLDTFHSFVKPGDRSIPERITELTGITDQMVEDAPTIQAVYSDFMRFSAGAALVAHNADFDMSFLKEAAARQGERIESPVVDTLYLSRLLLRNMKRHKLNLVAEALGVRLDQHHRAVDDARAAAGILLKLFERIEKAGVTLLKDLGAIASETIDYKNRDTYHAIILVQNAEGLKNLYRLISRSHMDFFYKKPRIPKSILSAHRNGLLIGSACQAGEVFQAMLNKKRGKDLDDIIQYYDYLEIQPLVNNEFLVGEGRLDSLEQLQEINRELIETGRRHGKPTVATCDAHYMEPDDALYRKILMSGQNFKDIEGDKGLYFRTTDEMLEEFAYLGETLAREVVIENPGRIADWIDPIKPIPDGTYPPKIDGSEETLRKICLKNAERVYGDPLPEVVSARLNRELSSIIDHGYAVMYVVAQMLVHKSMEDGYLVGSRGSVGSSLAATMSGITEVNPLPAHYICPNCRHSDFSNAEGCDCGVDMPDKDCPVCGTLFKKDGYSIPFEVFLGFEGDKEPDIDLNFAGEYQAKAHKYTETIFGSENVYRAGTIGTIASKTAYGFVMKYFEERGENVSKWEAERLTQCCTGVKRTTGQHPGGVMIVPKDKEIYDFCPIQFPANEAASGVVTTHFDYHSISGRLLKLDILGHDVPTMIKMLQDMTGLDPLEVPLRDKKVNSIFNGIEGIDIRIPNYRYNHGTFGIPEFGTKFVRQMLDVTSPSTFSDLVRISGLSHGTNVWVNNASDLIAGGTAALKDVISTRDDIMNFLIGKGVANKTAFKIMENVRKGKGVTEDEAETMRAHGVPEWYIESCRRIEYMFPKAHAVAYVMMSYRIAYYKVYYPLAFYAVVFSMKTSEFDAATILKGMKAVERKIEMIEELGKNAAKKEESEISVLELAYEMYARGFEFEPASIGVSDALNFRISDGKVVLPLVALSGVGESAALSITAEYGKGPFMSVDDLKNRAKINKTAVAALQEHGALTSLPESDQLSLF